MTARRSRVGPWLAAVRERLGWSSLATWERRAVKTLSAVVVLVILTAAVYHWLLVAVEGRSPRFLHSLQVVVETYTGTGFGSDSPWRSPITDAFVSVLDLSTFLLVFIIVPYVFRPVIERALSPTVPTSVTMTDHVVVCGLTHQDDRLIQELEAREGEYVVVVDDEERALAMSESNWSVIHGDPTASEALQGACVERARSVVVDTEDTRTASVILAVRAETETARVVVLVEDLGREQHLGYAGADQVLTPRQLLGRRIAERIASETTPGHSDTTPLGESLSILELSVFAESPIHGETVAAVESTTDPAVTVLGLWRDGTFLKTPDADVRVDEETVVLVAGRDQQLRALERATYPERDTVTEVVLAGHGMVGSACHRALDRAGVSCTVVDVAEREAVDVVGDVTEAATLREAGIDAATVYVVAIADDDEAILSILIAGELGEDIDVIARMNDPDNGTKARRAGADYVLSLPEISGRVLAREVLHEEVLAYKQQLKVVRLDAGRFAGRALGETPIADSECLVLAVDRSGELITDVDAGIEFRQEDWIVVAGSDDAVEALMR